MIDQPKVRIVQLLCPSRHCVMVTAYESPDGAAIPEMIDHLKAYFAGWITKGANPWCGLCLSRSLVYEDTETGFSTMAEALPYLKAAEQQQAITREYWKASKG